MIELHKGKICAVMTTFSPDNSMLPRVMRVLEQVGHVIIVDDTGTYSHEFSHDLEKYSVTYVKNVVNSGIAKSLNVGVASAVDLGYQWVLTLDDDSLISETYVAKLIDFCNKNEKLIGMIGVIALTRGENRNSELELGHHYCDKRAVITSGSLFHVDVFNSVGGFNEDLFIDLVDFDYCTKLRKKGYKIIQLPTIGMQHKVGDSVVKNIFGFSVTIYNHAPFRLYYQVRNPFLFFKINFMFDPYLSCYFLLDIFRIPLKTLFFECQKIKRLGFIFRGLKDGLVGKTGKIINNM
ncbi:MAG TPA: glycosyltransferase [Gammaproteobacteria bacterium]|nr:glycosyltransferase [Gammaproteobacteria bacterium]